jgi:formate--tetrahydrofolate ligase
MTDIEIARSMPMRPLQEIVSALGIAADIPEYYGKFKAKLPLHLILPEKKRKGKLVLVTAITPTPAGEGKTTVSVGLTDGLNHIGKKAIAVLREPSLGPVFGIKGGAAGGGYSQVVPMEEINLHFTGDFHAVAAANNLLSAVIDNIIQLPTHPHKPDPKQILWKRCMDMNDRSLREIVIGMGGKANGTMRTDGFNITAASEIMAILCLSSSFDELKHKLGDILVGYTVAGVPVFARDLKVADAMAILLKEAIKPNLVQTLGGNPALVHGGPFANIAQGTNTITATAMGLSLAEYAITEAGFGADLGAEKFMNIKCVYGQLKPDAVVLVATIRALRHHGGSPANEYGKPSSERVQEGTANLLRHIENLQQFGMQPIVAINYFLGDTDEEIEIVKQACSNLGVEAVISRGWAEGGKGCARLASAVVDAIERKTSQFAPLYNHTLGIKEKIELICKKIYRAQDVHYTSKAESDIRNLIRLGKEHLPVCMAKTQKSFSDNEKKINAPSGFIITVRELELALGAGFVIPILGNMMRMPGLPTVPASEGMSIDSHGNISGLS